MNDPPPYRIREVCQILNLTEYQVRGAIKSGQLDAYRIGKQWRIRPDSVSLARNKPGYNESALFDIPAHQLDGLYRLSDTDLSDLCNAVLTEILKRRRAQKKSSFT